MKTELRTQRKNRPLRFAIEFVLDTKGPAPHLIDVLTDGTSLVANYQQMFAQIIGSNGFGALIARMQQKLASIP